MGWGGFFHKPPQAQSARFLDHPSMPCQPGEAEPPPSSTAVRAAGVTACIWPAVHPAFSSPIRSHCPWLPRIGETAGRRSAAARFRPWGARLRVPTPWSPRRRLGSRRVQVRIRHPPHGAGKGAWKAGGKRRGKAPEEAAGTRGKRGGGGKECEGSRAIDGELARGKTEEKTRRGKEQNGGGRSISGHDTSPPRVASRGCFVSRRSVCSK